MAMTQSPAMSAAVARHRNRHGFALLSIMVAVVLLATGVMAIGAANTTRMRYQTTATSRSAALTLARTYLENVRARDPWSVVPESLAAVDGTGTVTPAGEFTRRLIVTTISANLIRIQVVVTAPRLPSAIVLTTNLYRGGTMAPIT